MYAVRPKSIKVKTAPDQLYTAAIQKEFSRISTTTEDDLINSFIQSATKKAENFTQIAFLNTVFTAYYDCFPCAFELPKGRVSAIASIKYYDTDNQLQTLSSDYYDSDLNSKPAIIREAKGYSWPSVYDRLNAVEVEYTAGFGVDTDSVPVDVLTAVKLFAGTFYDSDRVDRRAGNNNLTAAELILTPYIQY
ncbi:head-tail connector protein [Chondrinema litorale]|uniref:head-tail connector protein n=1 Tax=Chondrinema litorale TaxID=2994555 RepID=UPI0025429573|nr:phage head-tail connector protein [Chondrinema litorale]UZS00263.1 phage head-tail connector protein [Chondrinema litorale]